MQKAIDKLKAEMNKDKNPYVQVVGQYLINHVQNNPQDAEKIVAADKTILKSLDMMKKAAEKKKVGNVAILTDAEGFSVVLKYFGINGQPTIFNYVPSAEPNPSKKENASFDVKLEDLL